MSYRPGYWWRRPRALYGVFELPYSSYYEWLNIAFPPWPLPTSNVRMLLDQRFDYIMCVDWCYYTNPTDMAMMG